MMTGHDAPGRDAQLPWRPATVPGYTFSHVLGSGATADVCLYRTAGRDHGQDGDLAVKITKRRLSDTDLARFQAETSALTTLSDHPNILTAHDAFVDDLGRGCLLLEYAPNGSCADLLGKRPLSADHVADMGMRLADALHEAHRHGIVHRDIKPSNVLLDEQGMPLLADFGICADLYGSDTVTGLSPAWSAPEVLAGINGGTDLSDMYSLGATLFALLTGQPPLRRPDTASSQSHDRPATDDPTRSGNGHVPPGDAHARVLNVLYRAMAQHPDDRFASMADFRNALEHAARHERHGRGNDSARNATHNRTSAGTPNRSDRPQTGNAANGSAPRTDAKRAIAPLPRLMSPLITLLVVALAMPLPPASITPSSERPAEIGPSGIITDKDPETLSANRRGRSMPDDLLDATADNDHHTAQDNTTHTNNATNRMPTGDTP